MSPVNHRNEERPQHCLRSSLREALHKRALAGEARQAGPEGKLPRRKTGLPLFLDDIRMLAPAIGAILAYGLVTHLIFDRFCPMLILTGCPCPGCGMTRALFLALTGQFSRAWEFQSPVYGWILFGLAFGIRRYFIRKPFSSREKSGWLLLLSLLLISSLVLYGYRIFHGFPEGIAEPGRTLPEVVKGLCGYYLQPPHPHAHSSPLMRLQSRSLRS